MSFLIVIREYKPNDAHSVNEVVRNAYLSNASATWMNALMKEVRIYN